MPQKVEVKAKEILSDVKEEVKVDEILSDVKEEVKVDEIVSDVKKEVKVDEILNKVKGEPEQNPLMATVHRVLLVTMGALALTQEEVERIIQKLQERGEIAEQDGKRILKDLMERRKRDAKKFEQEIDKRVEEIMGRLNVPDKSEIDNLMAKVTELSKKVDELKKG